MTDTIRVMIYFFDTPTMRAIWAFFPTNFFEMLNTVFRGSEFESEIHEIQDYLLY